MKKIIPVLCGGVWLLSFVSALAGEYTETFDAGKDPKSVFAGLLTIGQDDIWKGRLENGAYILSNDVDEGAVHFHYLGEIPGQTQGSKDVSNSTVSVDVGGQFANNISGAGLIFRYDAKRKFYYALLMKRNGAYSFIKRDANGFNETMSGTSGDAQGRKTNRLTIKGKGQMVEIFLNAIQ